MLELAVSSKIEPYWNSFKMTKLLAARRRFRSEKTSRAVPTEGKKISSVPGWKTILKKLARKHASTFDFCKLSCRDMIKRMENHARYPQEPAVLIGHSKDFVNDRQLERFLVWLKTDGTFKSVTFSEYLRQRIDGR